MKHYQKYTQCELLSFIGKLLFSWKVLPAGGIFLPRIFDPSNTVTHQNHHLKPTTEELQWWLDFLPTGCGTSLIQNTRWTHPHQLCTSIWCSWITWMGSVLELLVTPVEGINCHSVSSTYMGPVLVSREKILFYCVRERDAYMSFACIICHTVATVHTKLLHA